MTKGKVKNFVKKHWVKIAIVGGALAGVGLTCAIRSRKANSYKLANTCNVGPMTLGDFGDFGEKYIEATGNKYDAGQVVDRVDLFMTVDD